MKDAERENTLRRLSEEEARLSALDREREGVRSRVETLRVQLAAPAPCVARVAAPDGGSPAPPTPAEKIALFRRLFRGREDVFPRLWVNARKGKKGYAPACSNEWVRGICEKPRVKCGECPNQAFIPVEDQVLLDHLQGRHVIGVYPLLHDETCWFLAADFDKASWQEDVGAFVETCRAFRVPATVERSRSGNGAHVWFFFEAPVSAAVARRMGCFLLTETMSRRHQLSMASYDRLFPNQDTMPRGGFGNLIALPLQHEPRQKGNTVFLDARFDPLADQWGFLAGVPRMEPEAVETLAAEAVRRGQVVGVRVAEPFEGDDDAPWLRPPSGRPRKRKIPGPLPAEVRAVLAQRLFVDKAGLPSPLLNQIKRLAAFQNPEFYKKQSMRLSTTTTPRVIACAEESPEYMGLPRGCRTDLEGLLDEHGVALQVEDRREGGTPIDLPFQGQLTPIQVEASEALLAHETGVLVAPPGTGKTVIAASLIARRGRNTLVLVHRRMLLDQWVARLAMFLGLAEKEIGRVSSGKRKVTGKLDVAMIQSLVRKGEVDDLVGSYGHVVVDECHHIPAFSFERVLAEIKARFVLGLTATPQRRDGHQPITEMQLGPVRFVVDPKSAAVARPFHHRLLIRDTAFRMEDGVADAGIQAVYRALAADEARNRLILDDLLRAVREGRSPILLTERKSHLVYFEERLRGLVPHVVVLRGGVSAKARAEAAGRLASIPAGEARVVLATGRYVGEGFDEARLDTLFLALPVSWKGTLVQYAGRLHRTYSGKTEVRVYDYVDRAVPVLLRMFEKRLRGYRAIGYAPDGPLFDAGGAQGAPVVREATVPGRGL